MYSNEDRKIIANNIVKMYKNLKNNIFFTNCIMPFFVGYSTAYILTHLYSFIA